jgi:hypothetical protein
MTIKPSIPWPMKFGIFGIILALIFFIVWLFVFSSKDTIFTASKYLGIVDGKTVPTARTIKQFKVCREEAENQASHMHNRMLNRAPVYTIALNAAKLIENIAIFDRDITVSNMRGADFCTRLKEFEDSAELIRKNVAESKNEHPQKKVIRAWLDKADANIRAWKELHTIWSAKTYENPISASSTLFNNVSTMIPEIKKFVEPDSNDSKFRFGIEDFLSGISQNLDIVQNVTAMKSAVTVDDVALVAVKKLARQEIDDLVPQVIRDTAVEQYRRYLPLPTEMIDQDRNIRLITKIAIAEGIESLMKEREDPRNQELLVFLDKRIKLLQGIQSLIVDWEKNPLGIRDDKRKKLNLSEESDGRFGEFCLGQQLKIFSERWLIVANHNTVSGNNSYKDLETRISELTATRDSILIAELQNICKTYLEPYEILKGLIDESSRIAADPSKIQNAWDKTHDYNFRKDSRFIGARVLYHRLRRPFFPLGEPQEAESLGKQLQVEAKELNKDAAVEDEIKWANDMTAFLNDRNVLMTTARPPNIISSDIAKFNLFLGTGETTNPHVKAFINKHKSFVDSWSEALTTEEKCETNANLAEIIEKWQQLKKNTTDKHWQDLVEARLGPFLKLKLVLDGSEKNRWVQIDSLRTDFFNPKNPAPIAAQALLHRLRRPYVPFEMSPEIQKRIVKLKQEASISGLDDEIKWSDQMCQAIELFLKANNLSRTDELIGDDFISEKIDDDVLAHKTAIAFIKKLRNTRKAFEGVSSTEGVLGASALKWSGLEIKTLNTLQKNVEEKLKILCETSKGTPWETKTNQRIALWVNAADKMQGKKTPDEIVESLYSYFVDKQSDPEFSSSLRMFLPAIMCMNLHVSMADNIDLEAKANILDEKAKGLKDRGAKSDFFNTCSGAARSLKIIKNNEEKALMVLEIISKNSKESDASKTAIDSFRQVKSACTDENMLQYRKLRKDGAIDLYCKDIEVLLNIITMEDKQTWIPTGDLRSWLEEFNKNQGWASEQQKTTVEAIQKQLLILQYAEQLDGEGRFDEAQKTYEAIIPLTIRINCYKDQRIVRDKALQSSGTYTLERFLVNADPPDLTGRDTENEAKVIIQWQNRSATWTCRDQQPRCLRISLKNAQSFTWNWQESIHIRVEDVDDLDPNDLLLDKKFSGPHALKNFADAIGVSVQRLGFQYEWPTPITLIKPERVRVTTLKEAEALITDEFDRATKEPGFINDSVNGIKAISQ